MFYGCFFLFSDSAGQGRGDGVYVHSRLRRRDRLRRRNLRRRNRLRRRGRLRTAITRRRVSGTATLRL